ncbi:MAG: hypothetical protein HY235_07815 [Acidobacteria bacterium]|nr:hypothetical protein [Acidobacteriota bacterium]
MAKVVDPRRRPEPGITIPGLKPPVRDFTPVDDGDPSEVDAFNQMIRELRDQNPAAQPEPK